ncbi:MAG TPA: peptidoglycan-binding protein [Candidatus Paceibacterota bacterium]|nr:peptidoglycan-binding protein [Candidatus Paceibacterota bacterium]
MKFIRGRMFKSILCAASVVAVIISAPLALAATSTGSVLDYHTFDEDYTRPQYVYHPNEWEEWNAAREAAAREAQQPIAGYPIVPALSPATHSSNAELVALIARLQEEIARLERQLSELNAEGDRSEAILVRGESVVLSRTLSRGMSGSDVEALQRYLSREQDVYPEGKVTGYFGDLTERAVVRFQEKHGLEPVGVVGPKTRVLLSGENATPVTATPSFTGTITQISASTSPEVLSRTSVQSTTSSVYRIPTGYYHGTQTYVSEPTAPASAPTSISASLAATSTASTTPVVVPIVPTIVAPPSSLADITGPTITSLTISPTRTAVGGAVSFQATAEDPSGIQTIVYDIAYPGSGYVLRPNCNFNGVTVGTCGFGESIDHGIQNPSLLGEYTISIRIVDMLGNVAAYYPNGTVTNGITPTHSHTIPVITVVAPE